MYVVDEPKTFTQNEPEIKELKPKKNKHGKTLYDILHDMKLSIFDILYFQFIISPAKSIYQ